MTLLARFMQCMQNRSFDAPDTSMISFSAIIALMPYFDTSSSTALYFSLRVFPNIALSFNWLMWCSAVWNFSCAVKVAYCQSMTIKEKVSTLLTYNVASSNPISWASRDHSDAMPLASKAKGRAIVAPLESIENGNQGTWRIYATMNACLISSCANNTSRSLN